MVLPDDTVTPAYVIRQLSMDKDMLKECPDVGFDHGYKDNKLLQTIVDGHVVMLNV